AAGPLKELQSKRLKNLVKYLSENSPFYTQKFAAQGVDAASVTSIDDIVRLPFTTKEDMRDTYPYGLFSMKPEDICEIHVSSGTTGNPTLVGYSKKDLLLWAEVVARSLGCADIRRDDIIQIAYGYGLFTGGFGTHYGALKLGATILPMSAGQTKRQIMLMDSLKPRALACTPSYALYMSEEAASMGKKPSDITWEVGIFGAEPWSENMRREVEKRLGIKAFDIYGLSEIIGPGVAMECEYQNGLHIWSDVFYPEIIDPETDMPVKNPGEPGELVITTLTKEGIPLIRYRTRDIVTITHETCACGRTAPRISKIQGRVDDMIVVRGINLFPTQVEHVLLNAGKGISPNYQIIVDRGSNFQDTLEVVIELEENMFSDSVVEIEALECKIIKEMSAVLSITPKIHLVPPKTIERSEGKAKRIVDKRKL
ncbi:MAG: phenylacetate--CoA ligase, partial [Lactobacillales bacterium]|nr:phenylacetate--CoA ligase [Lactobacillales bacterium]